MSSRLSNWINFWMLCAFGLCGFYGYVLHLARNAEVTDAYRAYYIDRSSDLPVWLAERQLVDIEPLSVGTPYAHNSPEVTLVGWSFPESEHVWTLGHEAMLLFIPPPGLQPDVSYELVLQGFYLGGEQLIIVMVNGGETGRSYRDGEDIVIPLQFALFGESFVEIRLDMPDARPPGTRDPRVLSFALQSVLLREAESQSHPRR